MSRRSRRFAALHANRGGIPHDRASQRPPQPKRPSVPTTWSCAPADRIYLTVPFADRAAVKALGAHYDTEHRRWFISPSLPRACFAMWLTAEHQPLPEPARAPLPPRPRCPRCDRFLTNGHCWPCLDNIRSPHGWI